MATILLNYLILSIMQPCELDVINILILWMRELRVKEVNFAKVLQLLAESETGLHSTLLTPKPESPLTENGEIKLYIHHA